MQPVLFINRLVGTQGIFSTDEIEEYLNRVIVSRYNDYMGETIDSILNLPAQYDELSEGLAQRLTEMVPCAEMVRFAGSGTETVMHGLRLARAATERASAKGLPPLKSKLSDVLAVYILGEK